jgi:bis(5'-nucleosyl)-tetraphosphatase (symmetrical)
MIWAIGDVQGCMGPLEKLLGKIDFRPGRDRVWLAGDLVNRGPRSLDVLRWAHGAGDSVVAVLGNHDIHLLGRAAGVATHKKRDTLEDVLDAPDGPMLVDWLAQRPIVHEEAGHLLVHAGIAPTWTLDDVRRRARAVEKILAGPDRVEFLGDKRDSTERRSLAVFTLIRTARPGSDSVLDFNGDPGDAPAGTKPWWELLDPSIPHVVSGHWAAAGLVLADRASVIDTGCVWDGKLTALRLSDREVVQVKCR